MGISVAIGKPRKIKKHGSCKSGVGLEGLVGGSIRSQNVEFSVTCSHVLSDTCQSKIFDWNPSIDEYAPDAALLNPRNPCFALGSKMMPCLTTSDSDVDAAIKNRSLMHKRNPACNGRKGFIRNRATCFSIDGTLHRFPHLEIFPDITGVETLLPIPKQPFSKSGNSGAWIFGDNTENWYGMVMGGDEYFLSTFAVEAGPLMDYFKLFSQNHNFGGVFTPYIFEK